MSSNIRSNTIKSTKKNPIHIDLPKGYNAIIERIPIFFYPTNIELIIGTGESIRLNSGLNNVTILKDEQEVNYSRTIVINPDLLKGPSFKFLLSVDFKTTQLTYSCAKILNMYSEADPGFIRELDESLDIIIFKINDLKPQITSQNIEKIKKLIETSILRVIRDYSLKDQVIKFTNFNNIPETD